MEKDNNTRQSTKAPFVFFYGGTALLVLVLVVLSLVSTREQTLSSLRINLAGRQRMLSQKLVKEVLLHRIKGDNRAAIDGTIALFDETLHALIDGGSAPVDLEATNRRMVPPASPGHVRDALEEAHRLWDPFRDLVVRYETTGSVADLRAIVDSSRVLLARIDASVAAIQRQAERDNRAASLSLGLLLLMLAGIITAYITVTVRRLRSAAETISRLEEILPLCSNCKKIRTGEDPYEQASWIELEEYLLRKDGTGVTHGLCPGCARTLYPEIYEKVLQKRKLKEGK